MVPAALEEEDERLKMDAGRWMQIQRLTCQNHLLTKLTTTCVSLDLLAHISASKNVARIQPIFSEFTVFFCGVEFTVHLISFFLNYSPLAGLGEQIM